MPEAQDLLARHVNEVSRRGGKIFIPSFAVGRAQELIYELHALVRERKIPEVPMYVDSPLAVNATDVFRLHPENFDSGEWLIGQTKEPFQFPLVPLRRRGRRTRGSALAEHAPCRRSRTRTSCGAWSVPRRFFSTGRGGAPIRRCSRISGYSRPGTVKLERTGPGFLTEVR